MTIYQGFDDPRDNAKPGDLWIGDNGTFVYVNDDRGWVDVNDLQYKQSTVSTFNTTGTSSTWLVPTVSKPLFGSWLKQTKALQEEFFLHGRKFEDFTQEDLEQWHLVNAYSATEELHEAGDEISWKPWAKSHFFNREAYIGELVDALHFIGNLLVGAECTDEELNKAYGEKRDRNKKRQEEGYTGLDKCTKCKRAVDDIKAHGSFMAQGWVTHISGRTEVEHRQFCENCLRGVVRFLPEQEYSPDRACEICNLTPRENVGYVYQFYSKYSDTVHTEGYGCSKCHCDPGDDWK